MRIFVTSGYKHKSCFACLNDSSVTLSGYQIKEKAKEGCTKKKYATTEIFEYFMHDEEDVNNSEKWKVQSVSGLNKEKGGNSMSEHFINLIAH